MTGCHKAIVGGRTRGLLALLLAFASGLAAIGAAIMAARGGEAGG